MKESTTKILAGILTVAVFGLILSVLGYLIVYVVTRTINML